MNGCESASWVWAISGQHHARILAAMPGVELVAVVDARLEQAQAVAAKCGTVPLRITGRCSNLGRCRHDRRAHGLAPRSRRGVPRARHRHPGREADGRLARPSPKNSSRRHAHPARSCRSAISSDSTRPFRRSRTLPIRPKYVSAERLSTYTFRSTDIGVVLRPDDP